MMGREECTVSHKKDSLLMGSSFILMVDDDPLTNYMNKKLLLHFGAASVIKTYTNPYDALAAVEELTSANIDVDELCILLDVQMVEMDGAEFLEKLKTKKPDIPDFKIRIYLVSGSFPAYCLGRLKEYSLAGFFLKPLSNGNAREVIMPLNPVYFW